MSSRDCADRMATDTGVAADAQRVSTCLVARTDAHFGVGIRGLQRFKPRYHSGIRIADDKQRLRERLLPRPNSRARYALVPELLYEGVCRVFGAKRAERNCESLRTGVDDGYVLQSRGAQIRDAPVDHGLVR